MSTANLWAFRRASDWESRKMELKKAENSDAGWADWSALLWAAKKAGY